MKTIQEVMEKYHLTKKEYELSEGGSYYTVENIEAAMTEYAKQFINYAKENVEADYIITDNFDNVTGENIKVYIPKIQFEDIKRLMK